MTEIALRPSSAGTRRRATLRLAGAGLCAALVLMIVIAAVGARSMLESAERAGWLEHTLEVLDANARVRALLNRAAIGERKYLISGEPSQLAPSEIAERETGAGIDLLKRLTVDNPRQQERVRELIALAAERQEIARALIDEKRRSAAAGGRVDVAREERVKEVMDSIRELLTTMQDEERALLGHRAARLQINHEFALELVIFGSVSAMVVLLCAFALLRREISERLRAEAALVRYADETDDLYNRAPCGYHSLDERGVIVRMNDTELSWLGHSRDELVGKLSFRDFLTPDSRGVFDRSFEAQKLSGLVRNVDLTLTRKDGTTFPVAGSASVVLDSDGRYLMSRSTVFDVTERSRLQQDLDRIFELSQDLLCVAGSDGHMLRLNPAWERVLGHRVEEVMARPFIELVHPDDREATLEAYERQLSAGVSVTSFESRFRCKDGSYRVLLWNSVPVPGDGTIYASARDITERKRDEEALLAAMQATQASNQELEAFSYSVSHDLRAPLRAIDGFSRILEQDFAERLDAEGRRLLGIVRRNAQRMGQLIDDLLEFSRLGRHALSEQRIDMRAMAGEVFHELVPPEAARRPSCLVGPMPDAFADSSLVRQVWTNLLSNAVKFSSHREQPGIEVGSRREHDEVAYFVRDNGAGFSMQHSGKLFRVFQRLHSDDEFPGTGVGLAIVRRVVSRHGGRAWAESIPDGGSTFFFTLHGKGEADGEA